MIDNKKIALFFFGNVQYDSRSYSMIQSLSSKNYSVDVFHLSGKTETKENINFIGLKNPYKKGFFKFYSWFKTIKKIPVKSYSSIIASDLYSLIGLNLKKNQFVLYDVRDFFDELSSLKNKPFKKIIWRFLEKKRLPFVKIIINTSNKDQLISKKKFNSFVHLKYYTIYNYPLFSNYKKNNYLRSKFNINANKKILIYQGVLEKGRGIRTLIKITSQINNVVCVLLGGGPDSLFFKKKVDCLKLNNKIFFHDKVFNKDLLKITASADLGVSLIQPISKNNIHALPNKLFEYSVCGLPVLCSNMPSMTTVVKKYNLGKAINVHDEKKLILNVKNITKNKSVFNKNPLIKKFIWKTQEKKFLNIFHTKNPKNNA